nr:histidine kinase [Kineosporia babensis]
MVTAERTRIARELHDVVAHHISAVVLRAQAADRVADTQPEQLRDAVRWIALDGQHTLAAMRQVVRVLRSTDSGGSLTPQATLAEIPQIAARMEAVGMPVDLRLPPIQPILPAAVELAAVRIVQESLTNALIHARARQALVLVLTSGGQLLIEVHDDGGAQKTRNTQPAGIPLAGIGASQPMPVRRTPTFGSGHGLVGMRERAASCDGTLEIGRSHLGGWLVRARLAMAMESEPPQALPHAG